MPRTLNRISCSVAATLMVALPSLAFAAPPAEEAAPEAAAQTAGSPLFTAAWWQEQFLSDDVVQTGKKLLVGLGILIGGWLVAKFLSWVIFRALTKTDWDDKLASKLKLNLLLEQGDKKDPDSLERGVAKMAFYLMMALVVVAVLEFAGLEQAAGPISGFVDTIVQALPLVVKAVLILGGAWAVGWILEKVVTKAPGIARLDKRFAELDDAPADGEAEAEDAKTFSHGAGQVVFWLVMTFGIAGAFDALQIEAISGPLSNAVDTIISLLPAIGIAALIAVGGWILAKVARTVVTRALESLGLDKLVAKIKLDGLFGESSPSKVAGWVIMAFVLIQTGIAALDRLGLETLSAPMTDMMAQFWELLPALLISALFVVVGVFVGRLLRNIAQKTLESVGLDRLMDRLGFGQIAERDDDLAKPSGLVGFIIQAGIVLLAVVQGLNNLGLDSWAGYVDAFLIFAVTRVAVALVIVGVGFTIGNYVRDLIEARQRGEQPTSATSGETGEATTSAAAETGEAGEAAPVWLAEFARYTVLVFAFTMAVHQLGVAEDFVLLSFALLFGALCLAGALAFGLGSREIATEIVRERYRKAKQDAARPPAKPGGTLFGKTPGK